MIGDLFRYAANRATHGVVENVTRKASWGGLAVIMLLIGVIFGVLMAFWLLEASYGAPAAGGIIAAVCIIIGVGCLMMPKFLEWSERQPPSTESTSAEVVSAVKEEMSDVVDYFGPVKVLGTAFMLGFSVAKRIKS